MVVFCFLFYLSVLDQNKKTFVFLGHYCTDTIFLQANISLLLGIFGKSNALSLNAWTLQIKLPIMYIQDTGEHFIFSEKK